LIPEETSHGVQADSSEWIMPTSSTQQKLQHNKGSNVAKSY
jgi:hypothetical protein